ncbi:hypothetical protein K2Z84_19325 [Candidatus Binatia bacterium]|nr:hypothetical protein [Candidatus Binatia bacterium]
MTGNESRSERTAQRLGALSEVAQIASRESALAYLQRLDTAVGSDLRGYGSVDRSHAPAPEPLGRDDGSGFLPYMFTTRERASAFAFASGAYPDGESALLLSRPCPAALRLLLESGVTGAVLDPGTPDAELLPRSALVRALALATLGELAAQPTLFALRSGGAFYTQQEEDGSRALFFYDSHEAGARALALLVPGDDRFDVQEVPTARYLRGALDAGITGARVNHGLGDQRDHDRRDLERLLAMIDAPAEPR